MAWRGENARVSCRVYLRPIDNNEHILDARRLPVATFPHLVVLVVKAVVRTARVRAACGRATVAVVTVDRALLREGGVAKKSENRIWWQWWYPHSWRVGAFAP